jgi:hypothetical protein
VEPQLGSDPTNWDSDGDGLNDGLEVAAGTDANDRDTDDDGLWDGQEVAKNDHDWCYTDTNPLKRDSDGDGVGDYIDDTDDDGLANGAEFKTFRGFPIGWCDPQRPDTDGDSVPDGREVYGNPLNKDQTSDPTKVDTDGDGLPDDIDPRTWIRDLLPSTRVRGNGPGGVPVFPNSVLKGRPFNIEGHVEYNTTADGNWRRISTKMEVQVFILQDGEAVPISDVYVTGQYGNFKISCTIGDNVMAGYGQIVIEVMPIHGQVVYLPTVWTEN